MARYDKYDPISGGFRAKTGESIAAGYVGGVRLNASGEIIKSGGTDGIDGVLCNSDLVNAIPIGTYVDVMTSGEIVELAGLAAGTDYFAVITTGALSPTLTAQPFIGVTVEADRLIVRVNQKPAATI